MNKKNLLYSFFLLCFFSLNMSQVSAVCVSAFLNKEWFMQLREFTRPGGGYFS